MRKKFEGRDPFRMIRVLPDQPLFQDCPIKPSDDTIDAAEDIYLKFMHNTPDYIAVENDAIVFEWNNYRPGKLKNQKILMYSQELVIRTAKDIEWRTIDYEG